ncbi:hypothetical protein M099_3344 [Phocaeicola vulgatus str. 3975 RP4]|uniref:DDE transposase n=1 Tax=Phocaeicola vulgatus str. 3975 RP4 TaxID=1339352 RepID=A0A069SBD5_PHOVU|nr:hypothetical protein M099_3344 [Phocaeicola vulgatus str. 3975 RP4]
MERQYRNHLSGYLHWDQLVHAEDWLLFEKNIGAYICIDEVALINQGSSPLEGSHVLYKHIIWI